MNDYRAFLEGKIRIAEKSGFDVKPEDVHPVLFPHQKDIVIWSISGGRRAIFASFGLGKSLMQLETLRLINLYKGGKMLIVCPLGVKGEFIRDAKMIGIEDIKYITNTSEVDDDHIFYITNYERIRQGDIDPSLFTAVTFDEASILRSLDTDTTDTILKTFANIPYRFVHTATPSPNRYLELINYAEYLGIMDRGQALTRFFQRDSTTAGNLTLYSKREKEFWYWMSSWAVFITKPSDLGHDNTGYDLPPLVINRHMVTFEREDKVDKKTGQASFIADSSKSLPEASKEKRDSLLTRVAKIEDIVKAFAGEQSVIWCDLNSEQQEIEKMLKRNGISFVSLYGGQSIEFRENSLQDWKDQKADVFLSKTTMYGSGINMQQACKMIYAGITYKFQDFVQGVHRIYRFMQARECEINIIYTDAEDDILKTLETKWHNHLTLQSEMTDIIKKFGLNSDIYQSQLKREMFAGRKERIGENWHVVNNDCVDEWKTLSDSSIDLIVSSIPFGNHYEYSDNFNCFGHNENNEQFFEQMDYLVPHLYRTLKPGRIAAIHVKDRITYSYQNNTGFTSIQPFSDDTVYCFRKHGFHLLSRITVDTDVVRENASTYRLGWSEACKDMTKMGAGLPEYVLLFRKQPTDSQNAYADNPVTHSKKDYTRARWQLDAHAHWKTSGERLIDPDYLRKLDLGDVLKLWKDLESKERYDFARHVEICEQLDKLNKLPSSFMTIPPQSNSEDIWDDITRMNTLNSDQKRRNLEKHICPLQIDIVDRVIERFSNEGELVADMFNGIGTVTSRAVRKLRKGFGTELKTEYYLDSIKHNRAAEHSKEALTLF